MQAKSASALNHKLTLYRLAHTLTSLLLTAFGFFIFQERVTFHFCTNRLTKVESFCVFLSKTLCTCSCRASKVSLSFARSQMTFESLEWDRPGPQVHFESEIYFVTLLTLTSLTFEVEGKVLFPHFNCTCNTRVIYSVFALSQVTYFGGWAWGIWRKRKLI